MTRAVIDVYPHPIPRSNYTVTQDVFLPISSGNIRGVQFGSLVISGVRNYLIFYAKKAYPDKSRWIRWNKCLTFRIP